MWSASQFRLRSPTESCRTQLSIVLEHMAAASDAGSGAEAAEVVSSDDHLCRRGARYTPVSGSLHALVVGHIGHWCVW